jgi:hypothetical protein
MDSATRSSQCQEKITLNFQWWKEGEIMTFSNKFSHPHHQTASIRIFFNKNKNDPRKEDKLTELLISLWINIYKTGTYKY